MSPIYLVLIYKCYLPLKELWGEVPCECAKHKGTSTEEAHILLNLNKETKNAFSSTIQL